MNKIRQVARLTRQGFQDLRGIFEGLSEFEKTGDTPNQAYHHMKELFCKTRGVSNDLLHLYTTFGKRPYSLPSTKGVLGDMSGERLQETLKTLKRDGVVAFPSALDATMIDRLKEYARRTEGEICYHPDGKKGRTKFDEKNPPAPILELDEKDNMQCEEIQNLSADFSFLSLAQAYLKCAPILDLVMCWWSGAITNGEPAPDGSAQLYHFDMDRIKWIKYIIYLTDVTEENGPHAFIKGTHRSFTQPWELLKRGYARIADNEVSQIYQKDRFATFTAPKGTILALDTRAFHKGTPLKTGHRLVLEYEYCGHLFGAKFQRPKIETKKGSPFDQCRLQFPSIFQKYEIR